MLVMPKRTQSEAKAQSVAIYLGAEPERERRIDALDALATHHRMSRSSVVQAIADGAFLILPLGDPSDTARRTARLEQLAAARGCTLSELLRRIADGEIELK